MPFSCPRHDPEIHPWPVLIGKQTSPMHGLGVLRCFGLFWQLQRWWNILLWKACHSNYRPGRDWPCCSITGTIGPSMTLNLELVSVRLSSLPVHVLFFSCAVGTNMDQLFLLRGTLGNRLSQDNRNFWQSQWLPVFRGSHFLVRIQVCFTLSSWVFIL